MTAPIRPFGSGAGLGAAARSAATTFGGAASRGAAVVTSPPAPPPPNPFAPAPPAATGAATGSAAPEQPTEGPATVAPPPPPSSGLGSFASTRLAGFTALTPAIATLQPGLFETVALPPAPPPASRTFTQLAADAVGQLRAATRETLGEAVRTLQAKSVAAGTIMSLLERRTRIGEVLGGSSTRWSAETVGDFASAFQMDASRTAAMDVIVALAILNDAELEAELRQENLPPTTPQDLLQNRRIVYQYPPPGTELTPPYVILVAVEHQDFARADEAVNAILGQLVDFQGYRMPRDAAARLG